MANVNYQRIATNEPIISPVSWVNQANYNFVCCFIWFGVVFADLQKRWHSTSDNKVFGFYCMFSFNKISRLSPEKKNSRTRNLSNRIVCQFQCDEESILYVLALTFTQLSKNLRQQHIRIKTKIRPKRSSTLSRIFQMFMVKTEHKLKHKQSIAKSGMISIPFGLRGKVCVWERE